MLQNQCSICCMLNVVEFNDFFKREKDQFVVPLILAFIGRFLYAL